MRVATALLAPPDRLLHFFLQLFNILLASISCPPSLLCFIASAWSRYLATSSRSLPLSRLRSRASVAFTAAKHLHHELNQLVVSMVVIVQIVSRVTVTQISPSSFQLSNPGIGNPLVKSP
jgi:ABC-type maltose transport system permease subunit